MSRDPILGAFATSRKRPNHAVEKLKAERSYRQVRLLLPQLKFYRINDLIYGKKTERSWDKLLEVPDFRASASWVEELGWLTHGLCAHGAAINNFIKQRRQFGNAYLLGRYGEAADQLQSIESEHGLSFWLAERQLMLKQASEGFEAHKQHLSSIQTATSNSVVSYLITLFSNRLEPHVTYATYSDKIGTAIAELQKDGYANLAAFVEFHASPWSSAWTSKLLYILTRISTEPVVYRYNKVIKVLAHLDPTTIADDDKATIARILHDLRANIDDVQLLHLEWALIGGDPRTSPDARTEVFFSAFDDLVCGRFTNCVKASIKLIEDDPTCIQNYLLLARAQACAPDEFNIPWDRKCLAFRLTHALSHVAENSLELTVFSGEIKAIALILGDNHLGIALWQYNEREFTGNTSDSAALYAAVAGKVHSFELIAGSGYRFAENCMRHIHDAFGTHASVQYLFARLACSRFSSEIPHGLSEGFRRIALAANAVANSAYTDALELLSFIEQTDALCNKELKYHSGDAAQLEFTALLNLNRPEDAATSVLRNYATNPNLLRHVDYERLAEGARDDRWPHLRESAYWPALVFLSGGEVQDIYESVDDFLAARKLRAPEDILRIIDEIPIFSARVLLRDVLIPKVLARGALWASTPEEQRKIRTIFLRHLYALAPEDQGRVITELSELEQTRLLEEAYKNVEGPKFFLEFADQNRDMSAVLQGAFERYQAYKNYEEKGGQLAADTDLLELAKTGATVRQHQDKKTETSDILLFNMAALVFGQYLWDSNKGVNATLGTRIRHGALDNQLKRIFGANALLAAKDLSGVYRCEPFVERSISWVPEEQRVAITKAYVAFTLTINELYEELINRKLRIRVPPVIAVYYEQVGIPAKDLSTEDGLLDFNRLFQEELVDRLKATPLKSANALIAELQKIFAAEARAAFGAVKHLLNTHVSNRISAALDALNASVVSSLEDGPARSSLRNKIHQAKEGYQHDLRIIQNWFSAAERSSIGANTVRKLVESSWRVVNFASNGRLGMMRPEEFSDHTVEPQEEVILYEVLSILMRNIAKHSGVSVGQEVAYGFRVSAEGRRALSLSNLVETPEACETRVEMAKTRLSLPPDPRVLHRDPGGTGLARVRALLSQINDSFVEIDITLERPAARFIVILTF